MRKVHYKITLDIFTIEDDGADGIRTLLGMDFLPESISVDNKHDIDIQDVVIDDIEVIDSR